MWHCSGFGTFNAHQLHTDHIDHIGLQNLLTATFWSRKTFSWLWSLVSHRVFDSTHQYLSKVHTRCVEWDEDFGNKSNWCCVQSRSEPRVRRPRRRFRGRRLLWSWTKHSWGWIRACWSTNTEHVAEMFQPLATVPQLGTTAWRASEEWFRPIPEGCRCFYSDHPLNEWLQQRVCQIIK